MFTRRLLNTEVTLFRFSLMNWSRDAACRNGDQDVFYPPTTGENRTERLLRERAAKAICEQCPVTEACLDEALSSDEHYGIWGGMTDHERRRLTLVRSA
jgi:WhiB family redox-sensing transcriptional regulator